MKLDSSFRALRSMSLAVLTGCGLLFATLQADAQALNAHDKAVEKALKKAGLKYEIDGDGDFKLIIRLGDRTQLVYVYSSVITYDDVVVRTIMSPALVAPNSDPLTPEVLRMLLVDNFENKMGGWEIVDKPDGGIVIQYVIKPPSDISAADLRSLVGFAAQAADAIEKRLNEKDDL
jgi:hypothetical protein